MWSLELNVKTFITELKEQGRRNSNIISFGLHRDFLKIRYIVQKDYENVLGIEFLDYTAKLQFMGTRSAKE